jgi:colanic acid biosynthesis glycosyl transferase WcaI
MAAWLAQQGDEVRVITAPPYYPDWQVQAPYKSFRYRSEHPASNLTVLRCPLWVPANPSGFTRILHLLSFTVSSFIPMLWQIFWRPQRIIVIEPPFFCAPAAWITARLSGAKVCLHVQDFEVDAAFELGLLKSKHLQGWILALESVIMRRFDKVFTISVHMLDKLQQKGVAPARCALFPNWVNVQTIKPLADAGCFRHEWHIPTDKIVLLYAGNIGAKQGLEIVIEAARRLQDETRFVFVICGKGAFYPQLYRLAEGVANIQWHDLQPDEKLNDLLNLADIHLLPQRADAADLVMPSKLTGMLASGRPIIATALPGTRVAEIVAEAGVVIPPDNVNVLVETIKSLAENSKLRETLGNKARQYALQHISTESILGNFRGLLENL